MKTTLAQQYREELKGQSVNGEVLMRIARYEMADLWSNRNYSWIQFCDDSVLSLQLDEVKAYRHLMPFHKNGVSW